MKKISNLKTIFLNVTACSILFGAYTSKANSITPNSSLISAACLAYTYVNNNIAASGDGLSWTTAFKTIQEGIDSAQAKANLLLPPEGTCIATQTEVWVRAGEYPLNSVEIRDRDDNIIDHRLETIQVSRSENPIALNLRGGFIGTETNLSERNLNTNMTTLVIPATATSGTSMLTVSSPGNTPVFDPNNTFMVDGFYFPGGSMLNYGIQSQDSNGIIIQNNVFTGNYNNSAVWVHNSANVVFSNNLVANTVVGEAPVSISFWEGNPIPGVFSISNSTFAYNTTSGAASAISASTSAQDGNSTPPALQIPIENSIFYGNLPLDKEIQLPPSPNNVQIPTCTGNVFEVNQSIIDKSNSAQCTPASGNQTINNLLFANRTLLPLSFANFAPTPSTAAGVKTDPNFPTPGSTITCVKPVKKTIPNNPCTALTDKSKAEKNRKKECLNVFEDLKKQIINSNKIAVKKYHKCLKAECEIKKCNRHPEADDRQE